MYAVVETGGKQYRVSQGDVIRVERLDGEVGELINIEKVLVLVTDEGASFGRPVIEGASVSAKVLGQDRAKKVVGFKYKSKKNYRRRWGHRQPFTKLLIEAING